MFIEDDILGYDDVCSSDAVLDIDLISCLLVRNADEDSAGGSSLKLLLLGQTSAVGTSRIVPLEADWASKYACMANAWLPSERKEVWRCWVVVGVE